MVHTGSGSGPEGPISRAAFVLSPRLEYNLCRLLRACIARYTGDLT